LRGAVDDDDLLDVLEALRDEEALDGRAVEEVLRGMLSILTSSHIKKEIAV
jgi:mRNA-degrading endonuclease YafQ of YafQ-DinJ toxin-antitoxin module